MVPKLPDYRTSKVLRYSKPRLAACAIFETKVSSSPDVQAERFLFELVEPTAPLGFYEKSDQNPVPAVDRHYRDGEIDRPRSLNFRRICT